MGQNLPATLTIRALKWGIAAAFLLGTAMLWSSNDTVNSSSSLQNTAITAPASQQLRQTALPFQGSFEHYRVVLDRPLFYPSRRPFVERKITAVNEAKPAPQAPLVTPPQGYLLRGAVIADAFRSAIFERAGKNDYVRVRQGEQLQGWTVISISRQDIVLQSGSQRVTWPLAKGSR